MKLVLTGSLTVFLLSLSSSLPAADWAHFGHDNQFTSYNKSEKILNVQNVDKLKRLWGLGCDDGYFSVVFGSPAIYRGTLFTTGAGDNLRAYNAVNGKRRWQFGPDNAGWVAQPVVSKDGTVIYLRDSDPAYLYAVNPTDGKQIWKAPYALGLFGSDAAYCVPVIDEANNAVYVIDRTFVGDEGKLFAFSKQTGEVLWYKGKAKGVLAYRGHHVALKGSRIFVAALVDESGFEKEKAVRINSKTKKIEMIYDRPADSGSYREEIALCKDKLIVTYHYQYHECDSILCVYSMDSPKILWMKKYRNSHVTGAVACNTDKNILYVPTDPYLIAYDTGTGKQVWRYMGYSAIRSPVVANGVIYFLSDTNLYAIDEANGKKLLVYSLGYEAEESTQVAVANGRIYFSGNGGDCDLFALGLD